VIEMVSLFLRSSADSPQALVHELVKAGASLDQPAKNGLTPRQIAAHDAALLHEIEKAEKSCTIS
jgi:hypothetical protein